MTIVALELLTGATPYPYESPTRTLRAVIEESPRLPSDLGLRVDGLDEVIARLGELRDAWRALAEDRACPAVAQTPKPASIAA